MTERRSWVRRRWHPRYDGVLTLVIGSPVIGSPELPWWAMHTRGIAFYATWQEAMDAATRTEEEWEFING